MQHQSAGFIKIILTLVVAVLIFTVSGFDIREGLSVTSLKSTVLRFWEQAQNMYSVHMADELSRFVIRQTISFLQFVDQYIIAAIERLLQTSTESPPLIDT